MAIHKCSLATAIIRISALLLVCVSLVGAQSLSGNQDTAAITQSLSAYVAEQSFWRGIAAPSQIRAVLFAADQDEQATSDRDKSDLAIVPDLNATFKFRVCAHEIVSEGGSVNWLGWSDSTSSKIPSEDYEQKELEHWSSLIQRAHRSEILLTVSSDPRVLFAPAAEFKELRVSEIQTASEDLFHRKGLRMTIAKFSPYTQQINAIVPALGKMVTFTVIPSCSGKGNVDVGRIVALDSVRRDLRSRIEENGIVVGGK